MKIKSIRTHILEAALSQPFAYSRAWYDSRTAMLVEIEIQLSRNSEGSWIASLRSQ